jgi:hypothetical protein
VIDGLLGLVSVNRVVFIAVPIDDVNGIMEGSMCAASTFREPQLFRLPDRFASSRSAEVSRSRLQRSQ